MGAACGRCGNTVSYFWPWARDLWGYDPARRQYLLLCSSCGRQLCMQCTRRFQQSPTQPIFRHLSMMERLEARIDRHINESPFFVLCAQCNARLGFADGSVVNRVVDFYQRTGRTDDLAAFYESIGQLDKAGEMRRQAKQLTVKQVSVDLNQLIEKIQSSGLAVPYRCRSCGAAITVNKDSKAEGLQFCSYCGSAVDVDSLMNVLKGVLG